MTTIQPKFHVFHRTWWRFNASYPGGLEPRPGRRTTIDFVYGEEEARRLCHEYNSTHNPGKLSRKAEYERA